jgi:hypothetical protein
MKLAPLLAQFLFDNKRLELPGIGHFSLGTTVPDNSEKNPTAPEINFESDPTTKESKELIEYISTKAGKIKALASADLNSHIGLIQQFLNIGKPFLLEGIGSLVRIPSGEFAFSSGAIVPDKLRSYSSKELSTTSSTEESFANYGKGVSRSGNINWRKPAALVLILAGIGLAVWGGYTVYKFTTSKNKIARKEKQENSLSASVVIPDTSGVSKEMSPPLVSTNIAPGNFRFILETSAAKRAFERFAKLKTFQWNVKMETNDSVTYKLVMILPASPADTARIADSLTALNGRTVQIEQ